MQRPYDESSLNMTNYSWSQLALSEWNDLIQRMDAQKKEWEAFVKTGKISSQSMIAPEIYSSWLRCRNRGLDPYNEKMKVLPKKEIDARLEANSGLINLALPILHEAADYIRDTGFRMDLYDKDLYMLKRFGKPIHGEDYERLELVPGTSMKEADIGTKAGNLAALLERPVQIGSFEHYCARYHKLVSVAVPIMRGGKLEAVVEVTGNNWPAHKHTLALLAALKFNIENRITTGEKHVDTLAINKLSESLIEMLGKPAVVIDSNAKVILENKRAEEILNKNWSSAVGFSSESIWGKRTLLSETLELKRSIENKVTVINVDGSPQRFLGNSSVIRDENQKLQGVVATFEELTSASKKTNRKNNKNTAFYTFKNIVGESPEIQQTIRIAEETAGMSNNVLMIGESGTGKELFAQSIHNNSHYKYGPFIAVNCSAIPHGLLESELFGYEGGSFTGAKEGGAAGKFENAEGGTIFLDEINSMHLDMQSKILRTLQNKTIVRIGGTGEIPINARIIAAANVDLWELVKEGKFREDLYYRINVISIHIPPLRERREDTEVLINYFCKRFADQFKQQIVIDDDALSLLREYEWPGNVRELENVIERSFVWARAKGMQTVTVEALMEYRGIKDYFSGEDSEPESPATNMGLVDRSESRALQEKQSSLGDLEKMLILETLKENGGNVQATAAKLGIARNTLYRRMKKHGIENPF